MYEIGLDLVASKFDYFGGGGFVDPSGKKSKLPEPRENVLDAAKKAGYTVAADKASFEKLAKGVKAIAYNAWLQDAEALPYDIDTRKEDISLAEFTAKGIELLDNPKGFFMMVEGGKIDWACHANDALTSIKDTQAFDESMKVALAFMAKHPKETVIVVTGDHECGGLTIGFAGTKYENFFTVLDGQKVSFQKFSAEILKEYKEKNAGKYNFDDMKPIITANFGLKFEGDAKADRAVLKDFEIAQLKEAFERSMAGDTEKSKDEQTYLLYGGYTPADRDHHPHPEPEGRPGLDLLLPHRRAGGHLGRRRRRRDLRRPLRQHRPGAEVHVGHGPAGQGRALDQERGTELAISRHTLRTRAGPRAEHARRPALPVEAKEIVCSQAKPPGGPRSGATPSSAPCSSF